MVKAAQWLLCFYLMLKLIQYVFVAPPGFRNVELSFRKKLLRGEPIVFIVACAISVPPALWSSWYFQRGYARGFEHSADCYGRLTALRNLPEVETTFDALEVFKTTQRIKGATSRAAQSLELTRDFVDRTLGDKLRFYTERYSSLSRQPDRQEMHNEAGAIERCLNGPAVFLSRLNFHETQGRLAGSVLG